MGGEPHSLWNPQEKFHRLGEDGKAMKGMSTRRKDLVEGNKSRNRANVHDMVELSMYKQHFNK